MATAARRESHIGSQDAPNPVAEEGEEGLLLSELVGLALGVEVGVEGPRSLWEATVRSSVVELTAPAAEEEPEEGWERLVVGPKEVVVGPDLLRQREAPSRRCLVIRRGNRIDLISAQCFGQPKRVQVEGARLPSNYDTYIPEVSPADKIRVVDLSLRVDVLPWPHDHCLGRGNVYERGLPWICVRNPYRDGETVCGAAKVDWYRTGDVKEEGRGAIGKC
jgi:hypothetical protein